MNGFRDRYELGTELQDPDVLVRSHMLGDGHATPRLGLWARWSVNTIPLRFHRRGIVVFNTPAPTRTR